MLINTRSLDSAEQDIKTLQRRLVDMPNRDQNGRRWCRSQASPSEVPTIMIITHISELYIKVIFLYSNIQPNFDDPKYFQSKEFSCFVIALDWLFHVKIYSRWVPFLANRTTRYLYLSILYSSFSLSNI